MKKKLLSLALLTVFVSLMALGTAAYFSAEGRATNVITTGEVKLSLTENFGEDADSWTEVEKDGVTVGWNFTKTVVPGVKIDKQPVVKNEGEQPFWLRARVNVTVIGADRESLSADAVELLTQGEDAAVAAFPAEQWKTRDDDGWYYFNDKVEAAEEVTLFDYVRLKPETGNDYQNAAVTVTVEVEAVQYKNNEHGGEVLEAWPEAE